jgi:hypothetical protein
MTRQCHSCGAQPGEAPFPPRRRRGQPALCLDCSSTTETQRAERVAARLHAIAAFRLTWLDQPQLARKHAIAAGLMPRSRRSVRAALRHRQAQAQLDLVDLLVPAP